MYYVCDIRRGRDHGKGWLLTSTAYPRRNWYPTIHDGFPESLLTARWEHRYINASVAREVYCETPLDLISCYTQSISLQRFNNRIIPSDACILPYIYGVCTTLVYDSGLLRRTQRRPTAMQEPVSHVAAGCRRGQVDSWNVCYVCWCRFQDDLKMT